MKRVLFLSDLHTFCYSGLIHPDLVVVNTMTGHEQRFILNDTQKKLWAHWNKMLAWLKKHPPEIIVFDGDLCQGLNKKSYGQGVVSTNMTWQTESAIKIISTLPEVPMYFTQGTEYHENADGIPVEQAIAKEFGGEFGNELLIDDCGIRIYARHFIPFSKATWQYWSTPVAREDLLLAVNSAEEKYGDVNLSVFGHAHYFTEVSFASRMAFVCPCWQTRTAYAAIKGIISPPDIGWVVANIENKRCIGLDRNGIRHITRPCRIVGREAKK